ncbi:MAG: YggS family pyridoxal phosphate-dependent enzyme [Chlamydiales bacterium]|nr:YggS family pyridoxal phosphate-dependent enzyme [Chlamydiales bacterium]
MHHYHQVKETVSLAASKCGRNPADITLLAVSKNHPFSVIQEVHGAGCCDFGENRVLEALSKIDVAPTDIRWHLIGTLQKNKINKILGKFALVHSIDTPELAEALSAASVRAGLVTSVLLQVNTSGEESKQGLSESEWLKDMAQVISLEGLSVEGLMTMAPFVDDQNVVRHCFRKLREFKSLVEREFEVHLPHLSMGMSQDYQIAIEEGATIIRIGTAIFGERG